MKQKIAIFICTILCSFSLAIPNNLNPFKQFRITVIEEGNVIAEYITKRCFIGIDVYAADVAISAIMLVPSLFGPVGGYLETHNGIIAGGMGFKGFFRSVLQPVRAVQDAIKLKSFSARLDSDKFVKFVGEDGMVVVITGKDFVIEEIPFQHTRTISKLGK